MSPDVTSWDGVRSAAGGDAAVVGTYRQLDVRQLPEGEPAYDGHAAVALEDGTLVLLEAPWAEEAIRPPAEIERCDGGRVRATGVLHEQAPEPEDEEAASIVSPCLRPVASVEVV